MGARRLVVSGFVSLVVVVGGLLFVSVPAFALVEHPFLAQLTGSETPAGGFLTEIGTDQLHVAVDDSASVSAGDVYVIDHTAHAIDKFSPEPDSKYLCQITGAGSTTMTIPPASECDPLTSGTPSGSFVSMEAVAVDPATGDLYIVANRVVEKFSATGEYESEITGVPFPSSVAVDKTTGHVYIGGDEGLYEFEPSTSQLTVFASETPNGPLQQVKGVAVDNSTGLAAGDVYAVEVGEHPHAYTFNAKGEYQSEITPPNGAFEGESLNVAVDSSNGDIYVADEGLRNGDGFVDQFDASGVFLGRSLVVRRLWVSWNLVVSRCLRRVKCMSPIQGDMNSTMTEAFSRWLRCLVLGGWFRTCLRVRCRKSSRRRRRLKVRSIRMGLSSRVVISNMGLARFMVRPRLVFLRRVRSRAIRVIIRSRPTLLVLNVVRLIIFDWS